MLLTREKLASFLARPLADARQQTGALYAIGVDSREEVDELVRKAVASGGAHATEPTDYGFMYMWTFFDPDGHHWEVFWMDPAAVQS